MTAVLVTVAPIFLLIVLGHGLRRAGWPGEELWPAAEKLTYYVLFPVLLFRTLAGASFSGVAAMRGVPLLQDTTIGGLPVGPIVMVLVGAVVVMTIAVVLMRPLVSSDDRAFSSLLQGSIRFNTYLGFAVLAAFYGANGLTLAAIYIAIMVPLVNVICVVALAIYATPHGAGWARVPVEIVRNPLIIACVLGLAVNAAGLQMPVWIDGFLELVARAALPMGLLCVGAGLDLWALGRARNTVILSCVLKLAAMPALTYGACLLVGLSGPTAAALIVFNALPAAPSAYVLAREMGGDAPVMAGILTAQTLAAVITLPALLAWLN